MNTQTKTILEEKWNGFWYTRHPSHLLAMFRLAFCSVFIYRLTSYFRFELPWLWDAAEPKYYLDQIFMMPYFEFHSVPEYGIFKLLLRAEMLGVLCALFGLFSQLSILLAGLAFTYLFFLNQLFYNNHLYLFLLSFYLCAFMPWGKTFSIDALISNKLKINTDENVSFFSARLLQVLITMVYFFSVLSKLSPDWLSGDILKACFDKGLIRSNGLDFIFQIPFSIQAYLVVATESFICFALWSKRFKSFAFFIGVLFHLALDVTMNISSFSQQMVAAYILFMDPKLRQHQVFIANFKGSDFLKKSIHYLDWFKRFEVRPSETNKTLTVINPHGTKQHHFMALGKLILCFPATTLAGGAIIFWVTSLLAK